jgi:hypothetical protein
MIQDPQKNNREWKTENGNFISSWKRFLKPASIHHIITVGRTMNLHRFNWKYD